MYPQINNIPLKCVSKNSPETLSLTDYQLYAVGDAESLEIAKGEQPEGQKQDSQWPTQSQEHVYEFDEESFSPNRSMESTYAEVGPFGVLVSEKMHL